jgi:hypothetical protein
MQPGSGVATCRAESFGLRKLAGKTSQTDNSPSNIVTSKRIVSHIKAFPGLSFSIFISRFCFCCLAGIDISLSGRGQGTGASNAPPHVSPC